MCHQVRKCPKSQLQWDAGTQVLWLTPRLHALCRQLWGGDHVKPKGAGYQAMAVKREYRLDDLGCSEDSRSCILLREFIVHVKAGLPVWELVDPYERKIL